VPTVSFVVTGQRAIKSKEVVNVFDAKGRVASATGISISGKPSSNIVSALLHSPI